MQHPRHRLGSILLLLVLSAIGFAVFITGQPFIAGAGTYSLVSMDPGVNSTTSAPHPPPGADGNVSLLPTSQHGTNPSQSHTRPTNTPTTREPMPTPRIPTAAELAAYPPPRLDQTPLPPVPTPTIDPDPPISVRIHAHGMADIRSSTRSAPVIVIGTIKEVGPAKWTTADGKRPSSVAAGRGTNGNTIFRPVVLEVDQYIKGHRSQSLLYLFAWGGQVGRDVYEESPDNRRNSFVQGEKVVVFLKGLDFNSPAFNDQPHWWVNDHYTITPDNQASSFYHTIALEQLLSDIQTALQP